VPDGGGSPQKLLNVSGIRLQAAVETAPPAKSTANRLRDHAVAVADSIAGWKVGPTRSCGGSGMPADISRGSQLRCDERDVRWP
jgi:hypothetical protein